MNIHTWNLPTCNSGQYIYITGLCNFFFVLQVGMSSLFINLMKVLNERISEWVHLYFYHKRFPRYLHLKFEKEMVFLERFSPYEITKSGDKISNF